jgi:tRNA-2-methylthio-N6-dimethylallyladenosine synthase
VLSDDRDDPAHPGSAGPRRYHIETWGCQMNVHDSEKLAGALEREGYVRASGTDDADVILLNTCAIREKASEKVFDELGRLRRHKQLRPGLLLGVCGCVAQQEGERIFARAPHVDFVIGPRATGSLPAALERLHGGGAAGRVVDTEYRADSIRFPHDEIRREGAGARKAFVTVIEGCNHRCTYCIVPRTRGREICRPLAHVLDEVRDLARRGHVEVEFLGQTVNAYRDDGGRTLADLLLAAAEVDGIERLRFTTSHPAQMTEGLIHAMQRARPKLCRYLHLPVQSGSSRVLRAMRRGYDREGYLRRVDALREAIPGLRLGTDVIVGYPAEEEADFEQTLALVERVRFDTLYSFAYSVRPGTAAAAEEDSVPREVKRDRLRRLQERQEPIQAALHREWVGQDVEVLVSGPSKRDPRRWTGRTGESRVVNFGGPSAPGRLERVTVTAATAHALRGRLAGGTARLDRSRDP